MQHIRRVLLISALLSIFSGLKAALPPPVNDTVCDAIDLGMLPIPGACPTYPYGDTIHVNGTTDWAVYNSLDFSPAHCFPNGSPDVWYHFRGTGSFLYLEMTGFGDLDSFFVKLHLSQGSCLSLVPLTCEITTNGLLQTTFLTPEVGAEYFLQIGGSTFDETGDFSFAIKSFNECNGCVKNASVELTPAPWFGRYGTSDTVQMCVTVERWDQTTTSLLHAIVPVFGDEWDTTTLAPVSYPASLTSGQWIWGNNIPTPAGSLDGFYFDADSNGDPTNNAGDPGNITSSWTGCWTIATKPFCNSFDAFVEINFYSDAATGTGNSVAQCQEYWPIHLGLSGWCCPAPIVNVIPTGACAAFSTIEVDPVSGTSTDSFDVILYDDSLHFVAWAPGITTGTAQFNNIPAGDYLIEVGNTTDGCISFHQVQVSGAFEIDLTQTAIGCAPGSGSAVATPVGGMGPFTYVWPNISTYTDSLAYNLNEGYAVVAITDAAGCTIFDSIYITQLTTPGATFEYQDVSYCHNDDTIQVWFDPPTPGGIYQLISPTASTITVDPQTGTISLNNATVGTPYWIFVSYTVGNSCQSVYVDSVQIVQQPATPVATSPVSLNWCIGSTSPTLAINIGSGIPFWYDPYNQQSAFNYSFTPATLNAATTPGIYSYGVVYLADLTAGCSSLPLIFNVFADYPPQLSASGDDSICAGDTVSITTSGTGSFFNWQPAPAGPANLPYAFVAPSATTTYTCTVTDVNGCSTSVTATIYVDVDPLCAVVPTDSVRFIAYSGITPNGDGLNDAWIIDGITPVNTVTIFNRWGKRVRKIDFYDDANNNWQGEDDHGNDLPSGTYYYIITQENKEPIAGWIELTR